MTMALSIAELSSAYPIAGACYSWLRRLAGHSLAWVTGFLLLVGYIAALADDDTGLASTVLSFDDVAHPAGAQLVATALICLFLQTTLSLLSLRVSTRGAAIAATAQIMAIAGTIIALTLVGL